eukprot:CAMPEP_0172486450 /NCGR_PEP_ID=MMETSP1066-20121228/15034_1 /TAXON_ID=671091 /ORGANISM="Coscinodiscus wailesii, Strain CCMP2513" /LENGTH=357 /DNA_ID=CAMNT_0013252419 /DNA_START=161 /DNA_END=1231 /DNA_ORIENTATION=+
MSNDITQETPPTPPTTTTPTQPPTPITTTPTTHHHRQNNNYPSSVTTTTTTAPIIPLNGLFSKEIKNVLAGGTAGLVAKCVVAPIDRIKILYQITNAQFRLSNVPVVAYHIIKEEGVTALWKGNTATLLRVFPYAGIQFMSFDRVKGYILKRNHSHHHGRLGGDDGRGREEKGLTPLESLFAGSVAGGISVTLTYPLDLTRAQLAVLLKQKNGNLSFWEVLTSNYKKRGIPGLFRGVTPSLIGILPYSGIAFGINDQAKRRIRNARHREPTTVEKMACGGIAGLFAQTLTYPLEVTRRRMQTLGVVSGPIAENVLKTKGSADPHVTQKAPVSMVRTLGILYGEQGVRGLFKGVSMNW